ncbi:substrate-binding domain-containing protein [Tropicimonas sp. S265A]|uniref:substrate-binding domain-containing protein n=1 Tax=Tropicimonas sp. S265A TaxID=3415134 RepID=UPI003C7BA14B
MTDLPLPPGKRATVIDVAQAAGVSPGTVSNAISGKRHVDETTRKRIEAAIRALDYRPNHAARRMRTGQTNTIAIFSSMPTAVAAGPSKLGFLMEIAASAAVAALARNTALILVPPIETPTETFRTLAMDGAIVVEPEADDPVLALLDRVGVPTVCIGKPAGVETAYVDLDYALMARTLIDHLLATGARAFPLIVGASTRPSNLVFKEVYHERAARIGMQATVVEVPEDRAEDGAAEAVSGLIEQAQSFDAVLVPTDAMATGVMRALRLNGLAVPGQVRVVTRYDGVRARTETPPLTAMNLQLDTVATLATQKLAEIIEDRSNDLPVTVPAPTLVVRGSSHIP